MRSVVTFSNVEGSWTPSCPSGDGAAPLVEWFNTDFPAGVSSVDWLLEELARIKRDERRTEPAESEVYVNPNKHYIGTGNAFSTYASDAVFYLEGVHTQSSILMSFDAVKAALLDFRTALFTAKRHGQAPPSFDVEWMATGEEAERAAVDASLLG